MMKKTILRALIGVPVGITIGYFITIIISLCVADGKFYSCEPEFINQFGSEINAVVLQTIFYVFIGSIFSASSVIWEIEEWSIVKQTGIYFTITALTMLPIAYVTRWMEHSVSGFLLYFGIFFVIFMVIWITNYMFWKRKVKTINEKINKQN